jgi:hypothetical protein
MAKKKKLPVKPVEVFPKTIETFRKIGDYELNGYSFNNNKPSCFNGNVSFKKYRVTIEIIDEPVEVYQERLEKLWVECDNFHHWTPLDEAAAEIGYTFKGERGSQRKPK